MSLLSITDASVRVNRSEVLKAVSLSVNAGELVAICGPNGAGKSTLLKLAAGLQKPSGGEVKISNRALASLSSRQKGEALAYLAQERTIAWNLPAIEVAALGGLYFGSGDVMARSMRALDLLGVGHLRSRGVADMSGGERARVLLARALVTDAPLLMADEPVAGLDPDAALLVMERLRQRATEQSAVILSLHDLTLAAQFADRVVVVADGRIVADDAPLKALAPEILASHFHIAGQWVETENGPLLATRRL